MRIIVDYLPCGALDIHDILLWLHVGTPNLTCNKKVWEQNNNMQANRGMAPFIVAVVICLAPTVDAFAANARAFTVACARRRMDAGLQGIRSPTASVLAVSATGSDHPASPRMPIGRITSLDRSKIDTGADARFYAAPRYISAVF